MRTITALFVLAAIPAAAQSPDPRFATARQAFVTAADPLSDDQRVASCIAERLTTWAPLAAVAKDKADIVLTVSGASLGKHPKALIAATLPDGTLLWNGKSKTRGLNLVGRDMTCVMAQDLLESMRDAMQKASKKDGAEITKP